MAAHAPRVTNKQTNQQTTIPVAAHAPRVTNKPTDYYTRGRPRAPRVTNRQTDRLLCILCSAYSDVVIIIMHDLHSNSGAIKLNQTGGMLKHLRISSTIDNMHCGLGSQQRSLESQRSMAPGPAWIPVS